ncbi:caspase, EACC1-associated type [Saccharopolyspora elongata]|nr:transporter substrate-binding domain-containing protein [Saccharopolyspora elongata]
MSGRRRALLIAVDSYDAAKLAGLRAPQLDAEALERVLGDPNIGGFEVQTLINPDRQTAEEKIEELFAHASSPDFVLLYVSGHGVKDQFGRLHFAMTNSREDKLSSTAVSAQFVRDRMTDSSCKSIVVCLDCCHAGAFPPGTNHRAGEDVGVIRQLRGRGVVVMTSSSALQYSFEVGKGASSEVVGDDDAPSSLFTSGLVKGLETGEADRYPSDGRIDVQELFDYVQEYLNNRNAKQTPGLDTTNVEGKLYLASNPEWAPIHTALDASVLHGMRSARPEMRQAIVEVLRGYLKSGDSTEAEAARIALDKLTDDNDAAVAHAARAAITAGQASDEAETTYAAPSEPRTDHDHTIAASKAPVATTSGKETTVEYLAAKIGRPWRRALLAVAVVAIVLVAVSWIWSYSKPEPPKSSLFEDLNYMNVGIRMGMPGLSTMDEDDARFSGLEVDIANRLGQQFYRNPRLFPVSAEESLNSIAENKADILIGGFEMTAERKQNVDFVGPHLRTRTGVMVKSDFFPTEGIVEILQPGRFACTLSGSVTETLLRSSSYEVNVITQPNLRMCEVALKRGQADAVVADDIALEGLALGSSEQFRVVADRFGPEVYYGIALPRGAFEECTKIKEWLLDFSKSPEWRGIFAANFPDVDFNRYYADESLIENTSVCSKE